MKINVYFENVVALSFAANLLLKMQPAEAFQREQFRGYNAANTEQEEGKQKGRIWEATKEAERNAEQVRSG